MVYHLHTSVLKHIIRGERQKKGVKVKELHMSQQEFDTKVNFQILDLFGCCPRAN